MIVTAVPTAVSNKLFIIPFDDAKETSAAAGKKVNIDLFHDGTEKELCKIFLKMTE
jgi:hypothetical protein